MLHIGYRRRRTTPTLMVSLILAILCSFTASLFSTSAHAMNIQKVVSSKGIEAWLVEDHTLPLLAMQFGFPGGTSQDLTGKEGVAYFVSGMMDEGAGDIKSQAFQERLEALAIDFSFDASRDAFTGGVKTLSKNRDEAFRLLKLALTQPRMDQDAVDRVREQILSSIKMDDEDPEKLSSAAWFKLVFDGHPYANPVKGTAASVGSITPQDLKDYVRATFSREHLNVSVVGDISAEELSKALDTVFGDLPEKAQLRSVPEAEWRTQASSTVIPLAVPQSVVTFGQPGPKRKDPDFTAAYILNYIIGGGGFSSTLMQEVREKRGLAYSVYTYLYPLDRAGILLGGVATKNEAVSQSISVIQEELGRIATNGPTPEELDNAKRYLTGSYALRFDSSVKIANTLLWIQIEELGIDYISKRNAIVDAVTLDDVKRVAAKLIKPGNLVITVVGQPVGLTPAGDAQIPAVKPSAPRG
jgi:zinc protease